MSDLRVACERLGKPYDRALRLSRRLQNGVVEEEADAIVVRLLEENGKAQPPPSNGNNVVWEDPRTRGNFTDWKWTLAPLMEHPGRWARLKEYRPTSTAASTAHHLKTGKLQTPPGEWEFASRTVDGKAYLYGRYIGRTAE